MRIATPIEALENPGREEIQLNIQGDIDSGTDHSVVAFWLEKKIHLDGNPVLYKRIRFIGKMLNYYIDSVKSVAQLKPFAVIDIMKSILT